MRSAADIEDASEKDPVSPGRILPARELLGDMLLESGHPQEALAAYKSSLITDPNGCAATVWRRELRSLQATPSKLGTISAEQSKWRTPIVSVPS